MARANTQIVVARAIPSWDSLFPAARVGLPIYHSVLAYLVANSREGDGKGA